MSSLSDLPDEVLLENLLPILPLRSLLALGATSRLFAALCNDNALWRRKCKEDFNYTGARTARTIGWKKIYKGLSNPQVLVWGASSDGRLGQHDLTRDRIPGVPYPIPVDFDKKTIIVELVAGGWSFYAIDSKGQVFVWGTLDAESFDLRTGGFSSPAKMAIVPTLLQLPAPIRSISCGRKHATALDSNGEIWTFKSWGRPFRLTTPAFDKSSPDSMPVQAECGWTYCTALTASGSVYVWWPFDEGMDQAIQLADDQMDQEHDKFAHDSNGSIPCVTWNLEYNPRRLPPIPELPDLPHVHAISEQDDEPKLVRIAAMDNFLIGLTSKGHVLRFNGLSNEQALQEGRWEYLPHFSETEMIRSHPTFSRQEQGDERKEAPIPPRDVRITHITAHFQTFVAYTSEEESIILRGSTDTGPEHRAEIMLELQYRSIISVVLGDYHNAALTADGRLLTWGAFSSGALGLGDPKKLPPGSPGGYRTKEDLDRASQGRRVPVPDVTVPKEVHFGAGEYFCFAATAAGWHTGALVANLGPEETGEPSAEEQNEVERMPGHFDIPEPHFGHEGPAGIPVTIGGLWPFRIGFAGRGRGRGGRGQG